MTTDSPAGGPDFSRTVFISMGLLALLQLIVVIALAIGAVDPPASADSAPWAFAAFMRVATGAAMIAAEARPLL